MENIVRLDRHHIKTGRFMHKLAHLGLLFLSTYFVGVFAGSQQNTLPTDSFLKQFRTHPRQENVERHDILSLTFDLLPTAILAEKERQRLLTELLSLTSSHSNVSFGGKGVASRQLIEHQTPAHWIDKRSNAVYSAIPSQSDPRYAHDRRLQSFHQRRHVSRYEMDFRMSEGLDLQLGWDGVYNFSSRYPGTPTRNNISDSFALTGFRWGSPFNMPTRRSQETTILGAKVLTSTGTTASGGKYDNYQAVPLSQGYGTHFSQVWVGSPTPQRKTVIVDTGSHYTAFPCAGCKNCGAPHHTDPYFDPAKSKTFHQLLCDECRDGVACQSGQCRFSQSYTEGSSWEAIQVRDRFYCGGTDVLDSVNPSDQRYAVDFMFGCQVSMTGLFITQLADGIMGMSAHPATLPKQLFDHGIIEHNLFAMCFRRELGTTKRGISAGSMTLGGVSNDLDTSPMVYAQNLAQVGWFTVYLQAIYVRSGGGQSALSAVDTQKHRTIKVRVDPSLLNSGKGVIVDSGTTDTYLNIRVAKEFNRAWKAATGESYSHTPISLTPEQIRNLPTILLQCKAFNAQRDPSIDDYSALPGYAGSLDPQNPHDLLIAIPATSYMDYSPITQRYMSRLYFTETAGGVLGSNTMQGHNVVFDWENGRIGFAESSCTYDMKQVPKAALDEGFSTDCQVGEASLTQACIETVDKRMCKDNPNNIALLGTQTWSAVVRSAGTEAGISCIEASKAHGETSKSLEDPSIMCDGKGLCVEKQNCMLTCAEMIKASQHMPVPRIEAGRKDNCGESPWSACDYGCMQTRIDSVLYTDKLCHEVSRTTRPCHVGACMRSSPCRVPFVVHTVLGFVGGLVSEWTRESEELLAIAMTEAARNIASEELFGAGDVRVLTALPWYKDEDSDTEVSGHTEASTSVGLKVVIEVSVVNYISPPNSLSTFEGDLKFSNFSSTGKSQEYSEPHCRSDDLYSVAKRALALKRDVISNRTFLAALIDELNWARDPNQAGLAAFGPLFSDSGVDRGARLLAIWTITTLIDDSPVNFYGPHKPLAFAVAFARASFFIAIYFMVLVTLWSLLMAFYELYCVRNHDQKGDSSPPSSANGDASQEWCWRWWRPNGRSRSSFPEGDEDAEDSILMGRDHIELTTSSPSYKLTTPKKRFRTSASLISSEEYS